MSPDAYLQMARTEAAHWWFRARRDILATMLATLDLPAGARILEIGSGTGGNLPLLEGFGTVSAREISHRRTAYRFDIRPGRCPDAMPFGSERFDLICLFDCLEHIDDDTGALARALSLLAPGGRILLTVPACPWLWSAHDVFLHHYRRYDRAALIRCAQAAGGEVSRITHFNTLLFPLAVAARMADVCLHRTHSSGDEIAPAPLNTLLYRIFRSERGWLASRGLPFGVSLAAVLEARGEA